MNLGSYTKAILAAFVAGGGSLTTALQDGHVSGVEWVAAAGVFLVGLGAVWAVPNVPESVAHYGKAIVSGFVAALGSLGTAIGNGGGITSAELIAILTALVVGAGLVSIAPNATASDGDLGEDVEVDLDSLPEAEVPEVERPEGVDDGTGTDVAAPEHAR